ncbi:MAG: hypothetical protein HKO53_09065 [Gemmatimonadetes bacterium]|nr:hypothetical protein [Gemmatimonadota bacterium]
MSAGSIGGWIVGVLMVVALAGLSRLPWDLGPQEATSELRLSWRTQTPTLERCRPPTEDELAGLPTHMRPQEICEGGAVPFQLQVSLGGTELRRGPISPTGDRTISVYEVYAVPPGEHEVVVSFGPEVAGTADVEETSFRRTVRFEAGRARLITMGAGGLDVDGTP